MNKTAPPVDKTSSKLAQTPLSSLKSVAVGREARPQVVMRWTAAYVDGNYYLADPQSMQQLLQVQAQIELERQMVSSRAVGKGRAGSVRDFVAERDGAEYSRVTEVDPRRQLAAATKAVRELQREEELYAQRLGEARNKKKEEKKRRNLIKVPQQGDAEFQSLKGQQAKRKSSDVILGQSIQQIGSPSEKKVIQIKQPLVTPLQMQSIVRIKVEEPPKHTSPERANIQLTESHVFMQKQAKLANRSKVKSVKIEINPFILDHPSSTSQLVQTKEEQRAGTSFFYRIHNDLAQLEQNINGYHNTNINYQQILPPNIVMQPQSSAKKYQYKQSEALVSAKCILKELNQQLREVGLIEPEQDSQATIQLLKPISKQPSQSSHLSDQVIEGSQSNISYQPFLKGIEQKDKEIHPVLNFSKKKIALSVQPSIVNYQIAQGTAPKSEKPEEKQKLNEEISLLRQVVGQLRVQRLKYQITQQSQLHGEQSAYASHGHAKSASVQNVAVPLHSIEHSHRATVSLFNNFEESVVSEFTGNPQRSMLGRSISGRIIRNVSGQGKNTRLQEKVSVSKAIAEERVQSEQQLNEQDELKKKDKSTIVKQDNKHLLMIGQDAILSQSAVLAKPVEIEPIKHPEQSILSRSRQSSLVKINSRSVVAMPHKKEPEVQTVIRNHSEKVENSLQISMPRPLNKGNNKSSTPQLVIQHKPSPSKKLLNNFHTHTKSGSKLSQQQPQQTMDPKRRAARQGLLKNIEAKTHNPELNQFASTGDVSIKRKIYDSQQRQAKQREAKESVNIIVKTTERSSKGFRLRKQTESSRNSRISNSNHSSKSCGCNKKPNEQVVYVSAHPNQMKPDETSTPRNDPKIYELEFQTNPRDNPIVQGFHVSLRDMKFDQISIPVLPEPPNPDVAVEQMISLIRALADGLGFELKEVELQKLIMKKYKNCIMLDLPIGKGQKLVWHYTGRVYVGDWNERTMLKQGEGKDYIPDKYFYRGHFHEGKRGGYGSLLQPSGACYEGHWLDGERNGQGRYLDPELKLFYDGQWKEGRRQGSGYLKVEDQSVYQGQFEANYRHGFGTEVFVNGDSYRGEYKRGRFHGKGHYIWASGASYEGSFCEGCKHGQGVWRSQTGEHYEGQYHQDKKSGRGQYEWVDGSIFQGYFQQDQKHGEGILYYADGRQIRGIWEQGKLIGEPEQIEEEQEHEKPTSFKKSRAYETMTIMKVVDSRPQRLSSVGKLPNF